MNNFVAGLVCNLLQGCGPAGGYAPPQVPTNPNVIVYQVRADSIPVQQVTFNSIANIGLDCNKKDLIINYINANVPNRGTVEQLSDSERRLNAVARTKIWQLRTYCS